AIQWSGSSSPSASARASEAIRRSRQFWNRQLVWNAKSELENGRPSRRPQSRPAVFRLAVPALNQSQKNVRHHLLQTSWSRRTDLMTNKSYAITTSLMRIGLLTAQLAVSPSAAAQTMPANASQQPALVERETGLALSAYPPIVKRKTAVYV